MTVGLMFNEKSKQLVSVLLAKCHYLCARENPHCAFECVGYQKFTGMLHTTELCFCDCSCSPAFFHES